MTKEQELARISAEISSMRESIVEYAPYVVIDAHWHLEKLELLLAKSDEFENVRLEYKEAIARKSVFLINAIVCVIFNEEYLKKQRPTQKVCRKIEALLQRLQGKAGEDILRAVNARFKDYFSRAQLV